MRKTWNAADPTGGSSGRARRFSGFLLWYTLPVLAVAAVLAYLVLAVLWRANPPVVPVAGVSMRPTLEPGDLVFIRGVDPKELRKGDVIALRTPELAREKYTLPRTLVHRIETITREPTGLRIQTRGDANSGADAFTIREPEVVGRTVHRVPGLGYPILFFRSRQGILFAAAAATILLVYFLLGVLDRRRERADWETLELRTVLADLRERVATGVPSDRPYPATSSLDRLADDVRASVERSRETAETMRELVAAIGEYGTHLQSHTAVMQSLAATTAELRHAAVELRAGLETERPTSSMTPEDRIRRLEQELGRIRELERTLTQTLASAEQHATQLRAQAEREAELVLDEARDQARQLLEEAAEQRTMPESNVPPPAVPSGES